MSKRYSKRMIYPRCTADKKQSVFCGKARNERFSKFLLNFSAPGTGKTYDATMFALDMMCHKNYLTNVFTL